MKLALLVVTACVVIVAGYWLSVWGGEVICMWLGPPSC